MTVWDPRGKLQAGNIELIPGQMIGKYRKMHMYDVDIPGGITMKESDVISPGSQALVIDFRESTQQNANMTPFRSFLPSDDVQVWHMQTLTL